MGKTLKGLDLKAFHNDWKLRTRLCDSLEVVLLENVEKDICEIITSGAFVKVVHLSLDVEADFLSDVFAREVLIPVEKHFDDLLQGKHGEISVEILITRVVPSLATEHLQLFQGEIVNQVVI